MTRASRLIRRIAVVVPARDEEELLPSCLAALDLARTQDRKSVV